VEGGVKARLEPHAQTKRRQQAVSFQQTVEQMSAEIHPHPAPPTASGTTNKMNEPLSASSLASGASSAYGGASFVKRRVRSHATTIRRHEAESSLDLYHVVRLIQNTVHILSVNFIWTLVVL
jgi:hypothetical protein